MRIVSLLPSATEMICAVGAGDELVGISHECDFPEGIRDRVVLTSARIGQQRSSRAIDEAVRAVGSDALSIYTVDERRLAELRPDVIVTQDLCAVCAVSLEDVRAAVARLANRASIAIVSLHPLRLEDVWNDVETVAQALGRPTEGRAARVALEERIAAIAARAGKASTRPRVVSVEWLEPLMLGGTWMPELIALAGGTAVGAKPGELAPTVTEVALAALAPEIVLVKPCGFPVARTLEERPLVEALAGKLFARVVVSDGNAFFNRPGPRLVESLEILAACIHPELFPELTEKHRHVLVPI